MKGNKGITKMLNAHGDNDYIDQDHGKFVQLKDVKKGEYIRLTRPAKTTYIRGDYVRDGLNKYSVINFDDMNKERFLKGSTKVWVGFTF